MQYSHATQLLRQIKIGDDIDVLLKIGLTYTQIASLVYKCINDGYIIKSSSGLTLTEKGELRLKKTEDGRVCESGSWISPELDSRIEKIDINDLYLPSLKSSRTLV